METVFFDASVLFKAAVTRFLLGAALEGDFRPAWSAAVVGEARRNLVEAKRPMALVAFEQNLQYVREPLVVSGSRRVANALRATHDKDRHVLAAAVAAKATVLVTSNARHFDPAEAARRGVTIATPDAFAKPLAQRNPHALLRHVERTPRERLARYISLLQSEMPDTLAILVPLLAE